MIVEREGELRALTDAVATAAAGDGNAVAVVGPAGIGKTALVEQAVLAGRDVGMRVLSARPTPLERELGFGVVRELLAREVLDVPEPQRIRLLADGADLALPALGAPPDDYRPPDDPLSTALDALHRLCVNLAEEGPIVLAVDDAHWADPPSLRFLAHLARRMDGQPIGLIVGMRTGEPGAEDESLRALLDADDTQVLWPSELSAEGVGLLIEHEFPGASPAFVGACARASGANPFYLGEIVRAARREGLAPTADSASRVERLSTHELARVVLARLEALGDEGRRLAEAIAIFPAGAELRHVARISEHEPQLVAEAIDGLRETGILAESGELEFRHPIIRAAVHEQIAPARRSELHRQAAAMLIDEHGAAESIVFHLLHAEPANDAASARILSDAARAAIAAGAFHEAIAYANRALAEPPPADERAETLRDIGVAEGHLGIPDALDRLRAAADLASTPRLRAEILRQLGWALMTAGRFVGVEHVLDEAISVLGDEDRDLALEIEADLITAAQMAMLPADLITARLRRRSPADLPGHTHGERCFLGVMAFETVRQNEPAAMAVELGRRALPDGGAPVDVSTALPLYLGLLALTYAEAFGEVGRALDDGARLYRSPRAVAVYGLLRTNMLYALGELDAAIAAAKEALDSEGIHSSTTAPIAMTYVAQALATAGKVDEAQAAFESLGLMAAAPAEVPFEQPLYARALLHLERNRPAEALADLQACGQKLAERRSFSPAVIPWRSTAALACATLGQDAEARRWAEEELTMARAFGAPRALGIALRVAGQVAPADQQVPLLEQAVATLADSPARLERARALVELGAALRRLGKRKEARAPIAEGLELARQLGVAPMVDRAREELVAAGGRPRRLAQTGIESLTVGERRVIRLAAEGRSNREIAHQLVVTTKTVEMHLRNAYGKLEIASRKEIDDELREALRSL